MKKSDTQCASPFDNIAIGVFFSSFKSQTLYMECKEAHQTSNAFEQKIDGNVQVSTDSDKIMGNQRRVSSRLKCIYDSKRPHYGTSQMVSSQCSRGSINQVSVNMNHFVQKTPSTVITEEKSDDKKATQNIACNAFEAQNGSNVHIFMNSEQSVNNKESLVQRRVSPRLKNISESKRPYYGVARRKLLKPSRDEKNQETGKAKSDDKKATQNIACNAFEAQNGSNVHIFMNSEQSMNNKESSVQRRVSPRLKNISESKRPYYGVTRRKLLKPSRYEKNQETGNTNHLIAKSSPILSKRKDTNNGCTSELEHLEQNGLPKRTSGEVKNQGSTSDLTVLSGASCLVVSGNGFIDSKMVDPKWLGDGNIAPNADGKSAEAMVKETLRVYYRHYRHFVQLYEKHSKEIEVLKEEVKDMLIAAGVFKKFKDYNENFKETISNDVKGLLSLYEATYLKTHGEDILDDAFCFTKARLESLKPHLSPDLAEQVTHSLYQSLQRGMPRIETRSNISFYEKDPSRDEKLLRLVKIDFNRLQMLHKEELCHFSR
ncbi:hypothetical protein Vadar_030399 [Vaccinium darrowii]|uniref:Uncharacterized protein n=1 Tax=Vaccinium darrowii TaxID=229202 RepID=A0ACB7Z0J3_9ERIC|nr:hypothetical protein Vadar_030399 [Vaccinium darrowii]